MNRVGLKLVGLLVHSHVPMHLNWLAWNSSHLVAQLVELAVNLTVAGCLKYLVPLLGHGIKFVHVICSAL